jgi:hypothetical protein
MLHDNGRAAISTDLQSLGLFRICFSSYLLIDFFVNSLPYFCDFYTDAGVLPLSALPSDMPLPIADGLRALPPDALIAAIYPLSLISFGLGFKARSANAVAFAANSYLLWRNPLIKSGAEDLAHLLLLWCLFLPTDRFWSISAALTCPSQPRYSSVPFVAMRLQVASLYVFSAIFKLMGAPWREGAALGAILKDNVFGGTLVGTLLSGLPPASLVAANYLIIAFQLMFPLLVYCPWRNDHVRALALSSAAAMHVSFIFCLNVGGFPYLALIMLLLLVPDTWVDRLLQRRRQSLADVRIYYDPECTFCRRISLLLREFLLFRAGSVLPASDDAEAARLLTENQSWVVRGVDGRVYLKWQALAHLLVQNPVLRIFGWIANARALQAYGDRLYDFIGSIRHRLGPVTGFLSQSRPSGPLTSAAVALCAVLAVLALFSNLVSVGLLRGDTGVMRQLHTLSTVLQVQQRWSLFAPVPTHWQHYYRIDAHRTDGSAVDLMPALADPLFQVAEDGRSLTFANHRWLKYFTRLFEFTDPQWEAFGSHFCRLAQQHVANVRAVTMTAALQPVVAPGFFAQSPSTNREFTCALASY